MSLGLHFPFHLNTRSGPEAAEAHEGLTRRRESWVRGAWAENGTEILLRASRGSGTGPADLSGWTTGVLHGESPSSQSTVLTSLANISDQMSAPVSNLDMIYRLLSHRDCHKIEKTWNLINRKGPRNYPGQWFSNFFTSGPFTFTNY